MPHITTNDKRAYDRMVVCATVLAAYSRMLTLDRLQESALTVYVDRVDIDEHLRLREWWGNLDTQKKELIFDWIKELTPQVYDITEEQLRRQF